MIKLTLGAVFLCIFSCASLAADPDAAGTPEPAGGASKGAAPTGGGVSTITGVVVTVGGIAVLVAALIAAGKSSETQTTTNH